MHRALNWVLEVTLAACAAAALTAQAHATTTPGTNTLVPVKLTNTTITVAKDKFSLKNRPNLARYPRGATITFRIQNEGTRPLSLVLHTTTKFQFYEGSLLKTSGGTGNIAPTGAKRLRATFTFRGKYEFELLNNGKIVARTPISVF
jgi:hypothetical protein